MFRLTLNGPDTVVTSSLCATCPHSPAGCCVAPPRYDWSDIARVVLHGGREFLLESIAKGDLVRGEHGLYLLRRKGLAFAGEGAPKLKKCTFHGPTGCTIDENRRPATCNYYVCESVYEDAAKNRDGGSPSKEGSSSNAAVEEARLAHDRIVSQFVTWDAELRDRIRSAYPDGPPFDAAFFEWLAANFSELRASAH